MFKKFNNRKRNIRFYKWFRKWNDSIWKGCSTIFSEYAEDVIFKLKERKEKFESLEKEDRTIISIFGETNFKRRYYQDKDTKERIYLLDQFLKLEKRERMLPNVKERLI